MSFKDTILDELIQRKNILEGAIKKAHNSEMQNQDIEGHLEISTIRNHHRYYYKSPFKKGQEQIKRTYLKDLSFASRIANRDYAKAVIHTGNQELKHINALINTYQKATVDELYQKLHLGRQALVEPILTSDENYAKHWLVNEKNHKETLQKRHHNSYPILNPIQTENHEIVRSKSEKIIADKLKLYDIPYIYEMPMHIGKSIKYPDFTALNKRSRKKYYWEHMGLLDQTEYFKNAISKINTYMKNGIMPGKNLIITYETADFPLDIALIDQMIHEFLL